MGADPESPVSIGKQRRNFIRQKRRGVFLIEDGESRSIVSCETLFGCQSEIAIWRLRNRANGILGQALFDMPNVMYVLRNSFLWIELRRRHSRAGVSGANAK